MKKTNLFLTRFSAVIFIFLLHFTVYAQDVLQAENETLDSFTVEDASSQPSNDISSNEDGNDIELHNIVVTAQKRKQNIQDVAGSISAMNSRQIEDAGIKSTNDIYTYVPNLSSFGLADGGVGFSYYGMRGQTNFNSFSNSIGIYIDDIPRLLSGNVTDSSIWDVEQIEVLRGPQGNLYGLSSSGGIINITTKKPENFWTGNANASFGNYNTREYKASISGPIVSEKLFFGISGTYKRQDSYVEEEGNDDRRSIFGAGRAQLRWLPSNNLEIMLTAESGVQDTNYTWFSLQDDDPYTIPNKNYDEYNDATYHIQSLRIKYKTPLFNIVSITGNSILKQESDIEMFQSGAMHRLSDMPTSRFIQELRLISNKEKSSFKWMAGGFVQSGTDETNQLNEYNGTVMTDMDSEVKRTIYALFGQASYTFMRSLTLTAGLRYDYEKQEYEEYTTGLDTSTYTPYERDIEDSESWDSLSPRLSIDYRFNKEVMIYTSAAKGYKSGGFLGADMVDKKFDQEEIWSYELGTKTNWLNKRLIFNLCGFYTIANDLQTFYYDSSYNFVYENTAKAVMYGFETDIAVRPIAGLEISIPIGYVYTEIKDHEIESNEGNKVPLTPEYTAGLTAQYDHRTGIFIRGEWSIQGKTYYDEENTLSQGAYNLFNAKLGYKRENFTVSAFIKNALDEEYFTYMYAMSPYNYVAVGAPRTFGAEASVMF